MEEKEDEKLKWSKSTPFGPANTLAPVLNALLAVVELEKERTLEQIEQVKKVLETMKKNEK